MKNQKNFFVSSKNPIFIIAEIGGNHEGNFLYAKKLLHLAIISGADAVKFQVYSGDTLVSSVESPERNEHFKRFELTRFQFEELRNICVDAGVMFMASVWDEENLNWAEQYITTHKIGSGDITAFPLIKQIVKTGKPIILSTGLSTVHEIQETLTYIYTLDPTYRHEGKIALLQCTTSYPCPDEDTNLNAINFLQKKFGLPVGYSDHTIGTEAALTAGIMGAEILETHFTDTREGKTFRDHKISMTVEELKEFILRLKKIKILQGLAWKAPTKSEVVAGHLASFRRSIYAKCNIKKGEVFNDENLTVLRPFKGLPAKLYDEVVGKCATRDIARHEALFGQDIE